MRMSKFVHTGVAAAVVLLAGCVSNPQYVKPDASTSGVNPVAKANPPRIMPLDDARPGDMQNMVTNTYPEEHPRAKASYEPYIDPSPMQVKKGAWLDEIQVTLQEPKEPISVQEFVRSLRGFEINVTSDFPLDSYFYAGFGMHNMPASTAVMTVLGSVGLDYEVYDNPNYLKIVPMPSQTWLLPVRNREVKFNNVGNTSSGGSEDAASTAQGGIAAATVSSVESSTDTQTEFKMESALWKTLEAEVKSLLVTMIPKPDSRGMSSVASGFNEVITGRMTVNQDTGTLTVQAPRALLARIDKYILRLKQTMGTRLVFEGRIFLVTQEDQSSRGIDWSNFFTFAQEKYGLTVTNNALGGVTVNPPTSEAGLSVATGSDIASNALGLVSRDNVFQIFSAFLESQGQVSTIQRPFVTTTSGVPAGFSQTNKTYINNITEQASQNQVGNQISRQNTLVPFEFGTTLRVHPEYDPKTDQVRALISLVQVIQSGFVELDQFVSDGLSSKPVTTRVPVDQRIDLQGEAILKNGAMVLLGGQQFETETSGSRGIPILRDLPLLKDFFGSSEKSKNTSTYYFALSVRAVPMAL